LEPGESRGKIVGNDWENISRFFAYKGGYYGEKGKQ
jgi:hypothetical protein